MAWRYLKQRKYSKRFSLNATPRSVNISAQSGIAVTSRDITYSTSWGDGTHETFDITAIKDAGVPNPTYSGLSPVTCTIDANGAVTYVSSGICYISATFGTDLVYSSMTMSATGSATTVFDRVSGHNSAGSLRKYLYDQQIAALAGVTSGGTAQARLDGAVYNLNNFLRRTGVAGFTALPADLLEYVIMYGRFFLTPHHYVEHAGHDMSEASAANGWSEPLSLNSRIVYQAATWTGTLAKVLPDSWMTKLPGPQITSLGSAIPVWARMYNTYGESSNYWVMPVHLSKGNPFPTGDSRRTYQRFQASPEEMATGGDSNSPVFCGINGDIIFFPHVGISTIVGGSSDSYGTEMLPTTAAINAKLNSSALNNGDQTSYSVTTADLSGFTDW